MKNLVAVVRRLWESMVSLTTFDASKTVAGSTASVTKCESCPFSGKATVISSTLTLLKNNGMSSSVTAGLIGWLSFDSNCSTLVQSIPLTSAVGTIGAPLSTPLQNHQS